MQKKFLITFVVVNFLLSCFYIDTWDNGSTTSRMLSVMYAVQEGTFIIDKQHERTVDKSIINGHFYSEKPPLQVFLTIPFYKLLMLFGYEEDGKGTAIYILGSIVCGIIPFLIILTLCFTAAKENKSISPVLLSMLPMYGSYIFIYSSSFYNHILSALLVLLSYLFIKKNNHFLAGLFIGLGFLSEFIIAVVILVWAIQLFLKIKNYRTVLLYCLGVAPSAIIILVYNFFITGSMFTIVYKFHVTPHLHSNYAFSFPTPESLGGLTFGLYRGLFFFAPFLILFLFYLIKKYSTLSLRKLLPSYSGMASVSVILAISSYYGWWGGWAYGPRMILFIAALLTYKGIQFLASHEFSRLFFWIFCGLGFICALAAKITVLYSIPTEAKYPFTDVIIPAIRDSNFNSSNILSLFFGVSPSISALVWIFIFIAGTAFLFLYNKKTIAV